MKRKIPEPKPLFLERIKKLLPDKQDFEKYLKILKKPPVNSIRCNLLKISPDKLKNRLEKKYNWKIKQPFNNYSDIMIIQSELQPGELGRSLEHLLGYYYVQELASMLPVLVLEPKENELILDLCAAPGSKTTQIASIINNTGTIIANEISLGRIRILASNTERCGVTNTIISKKDAISLCKNLKKQGELKKIEGKGTLVPYQFDKILLDAPCSGEGTLRSTIRTYKMWNINSIKKFSKIQKNMIKSAFEILKPNGILVYSTCTHAPEENEEVVDFILKEFQDSIKIEPIKLPIPTRQGITKWQEKEYLKDVQLACRVYPHVANTEGFFLAKFTKIK